MKGVVLPRQPCPGHQLRVHDDDGPGLALVLETRESSVKSIRPHDVDEFAGGVPLAAFFVCGCGVGVSQFFDGRVFGVWHAEFFGLGPGCRLL
jgi:hypothetical protein